MHTGLLLLPMNIVLSFVVFAAAYRWLLRPALPRIGFVPVLTALLLLHSLRHLGAMFVSLGPVAPGIPWQFAWPAAVGDCIAALLAFIAATLLQRDSKYATHAVWIATIVGLIDFAMAIGLAQVFRPAAYLGAAYWIPTFWVPMLIVAHLAAIDMLLTARRARRPLKEAHASMVVV